jgi:ppGpp synthetase/RelA/SpoT-type nucleotidyltranferase
MITNDEIDSLIRKYESERNKYQEFADYIKKILLEETSKKSVVCSIQARAKEVDSFIKKACRKEYAIPYEEIRDKSGVRITVTYSDDLAKAETIISNLFEVEKHEDKQHNLSYNELGYLGIHFEVNSNKFADDIYRERYNGMICEIQIHTQAQNLWATVSHKLSYKTLQSPTPKIQRNLYRLVALVELFDNEVKNIRQDLSATSLENKMLTYLEEQFYRFRPYQSFDREFSVEIIRQLQELLSDDEKSNFENILNDFINKNEVKLQEIFQNYSNDNRSKLLLSQPESLLIFERLVHDKYNLKDAWNNILPFSMLNTLAVTWGVSYRN